MCHFHYPELNPCYRANAVKIILFLYDRDTDLTKIHSCVNGDVFMNAGFRGYTDLHYKHTIL